MTLNRMTLSRMTLSRTALFRISLRIMTKLSILTLHNDTTQNGVRQFFLQNVFLHIVTTPNKQLVFSLKLKRKNLLLKNRPKNAKTAAGVLKKSQQFLILRFFFFQGRFEKINLQSPKQKRTKETLSTIFKDVPFPGLGPA